MNADNINTDFQNRCTCREKVSDQTGLCPYCSAWKFLMMVPRDGLRRVPARVRRDAVILMARLAISDAVQRQRLGAGKAARIRHILAHRPERYDAAVLVQWMADVGNYPAKVRPRR